jgi:glucose-6-phosphate 1-dehydrogenase
LITLCIAAKIPGTDVRLGQARLRFDYSKGFAVTPKTGYETLLYDVMKGDPTLFLRADQAEASWKVVQPLLDYWDQNPHQGLEHYHAGTDLWGPASAHALAERDGRKWLLLSAPIANEEQKEAA